MAAQVRAFHLMAMALLALAVLSAVPVLRSMLHPPIVAGDAAYYELRMAGEVVSGGDSGMADRFVAGPRMLGMTVYSRMLAWALQHLGFVPAAVLFPMLLGLLSLFLFYLLMGRAVPDPQRRLVACFIVLMSPAFIVTFSSSARAGLGIFFCLLGILLSRKKGLMFLALAALCFIATAMLGWLELFLLVLIVLVWLLARARERMPWLVMPILLAIIALIGFEVSYVSQTQIYMNPLVAAVSDLGASNGIGVFAFILAAIGFLVLWARKAELSLLYALLAFFAAPLLFSREGNPYLAFVIAFFACHGLSIFLDMGWDNAQLKRATILIIFCGLIFSAISFINTAVLMKPDRDALASFQWMERNAPGTGFVLSSQENGFWIQYFAHKPVLLDPLSSPKQGFQFFNDTSTLFHSRNLRQTKGLLKSYNIDYVWIDDAMKQGAVWNRVDDGLLFLFRNNETFRKVYDLEGIEIWAVNQSR